MRAIPSNDRRTASSSGNAALRVLFHQVSDDLGVSFSGELVAFLLQLFLQLEIVFDDSVMDDDDLAGAVAMRVGILLGGAAVGGPTRVADAVGAVQRGLGNDLFEIAKFARGAANFQFPPWVTTAMPAES